MITRFSCLDLTAIKAPSQPPSGPSINPPKIPLTQVSGYTTKKESRTPHVMKRIMSAPGGPKSIPVTRPTIMPGRTFLNVGVDEMDFSSMQMYLN